MELDKTPGILHIATGDWAVVEDALQIFNKWNPTSKLRYHSSVEIDGVLFSYIDAHHAKLDHIFSFGVLFESYLSELRSNGKIDW